MKTVSSWECLSCDETGEGTADEVDKAAKNHTDKAKHTTTTSTRPTPPEDRR